MRLRAAIETAILAIFLTLTLAVTLWYSRTVPADVSGSAMEYAQAGDRLYEAGWSKLNAAAIKYWEAIRRDPDMAHARFRLANIYYSISNTWNYEPLLELEEVERIDPDYPGLYLLRGKIYHRMQDNDKEFEALQQAVMRQPESSEVHYYLGLAYHRKGMMKTAIGEYEKATASGLEPTTADNEAILKSYLQLGRIFEMGNDREKIEKDAGKAEERFRKALNLDPTSAEVISELRTLYKQQAEHYKSQREYNKMAERYGEILKIDPKSLGNIEIYMELGMRYEQDGFYDKAAEMYEAAKELDPMNFEMFIALKQLEALRGMGGQEE
ncbi:tetratricopeptide repeat protein [Candidatus Poribacteria bacterium]